MSQLQTESLNIGQLEYWQPAESAASAQLERITEVLQNVSESVSPVWPLKDYVAVNPFQGISERSFLNARKFLRIFSDCEMLMPLKHYAAEFQAGSFDTDDIAAALKELEEDVTGYQSLPALSDIVKLLRNQEIGSNSTRTQEKSSSDRQLKSFSEIFDQQTQGDWTEKFNNEISKFCAMHYDQGESVWSSPWQGLPLYQAWRSAAEQDRNIEVLGVTGFRRFVSELPHTPEAALLTLLSKLKLPPVLWETSLLCQAYLLPGWSAWCKYQSEQEGTADLLSSDLAGLLAIRLAYEAALSENNSFEIDWNSITRNGSASFRVNSETDQQDLVRYVLLRATEIACRNSLLHSIAAPSGAKPLASKRQLAQMVFCIDVRSERIRRQLETLSSEIDTLGFAGFFGIPMEYIPLGEDSGDSHVPVLLQPQFQVYEELPSASQDAQEHELKKRSLVKTFRALWKKLQQSALGCFPFVESMGLLYGVKLGQNTWGKRSAGLENQTSGSGHSQNAAGPSLNGLGKQGVTLEKLTDLAESILKNMSLTDAFGRFVVFCGHESQTVNNPLKAGLDCGACGGHSGAPNARVAARIMNQSAIRRGLEQRGILIPEDTVFVAAVHNTTTDQISYFETDSIAESHESDLAELLSITRTASRLARQDRVPELQSQTEQDLLRRAVDWSEIRPEWGLAGNAALIIGPRELTRQIDLKGKAFLHEYNREQDSQGCVLETLMTAPMIVAHLINMQYYASTVDQRYFGSGNKTLHNVVGGFGILSGNTGDLKTGLPWESLHSGENYQHRPLRLQVMINADRDVIESIVAKHSLLNQLLNGGWIYLTAIEAEGCFQYRSENNWQRLDLDSTDRTATCV